MRTQGLTPRALTQIFIVALGALALALGAVLVKRSGGETAAGSTTDAGACDLTSTPIPLSPLTVDVVLLLSFDQTAQVTLDGRRVVSLPDDPSSFAAGEHRLDAACGDAKVRLTLELLPFMPGAVHVACAAGKPAVFTVGVTCDGCAETAPARKAAAKAGRDSPVFVAAAAQEKLERDERSRADGVLTGRWNTLTERYARVLQVVGREAPGAVASANHRFEQLSQGFRSAASAHDPAGQDQSIRAAEQTLRVFVHAARLARPDDCEFQKRLTNAF